jgi:hypothetical protein
VLDWALGPLGRQLFVAVDVSAQLLVGHAIEFAGVPGLNLLYVEAPELPAPSSQERIEQALAQAAKPVTQRQLREAVRMRASHVADILAQLVASGRVDRSADGYRLKS